jgi:septal ring-binding cell division protein DamX
MQHQYLQRGKFTFEAGNYIQAFHQLLPLAAQGNPEAQYAIGYMYYYGYGVPADSESGLFWMGKSAEQGYLPANKALYLVSKPSKPLNPTPENAISPAGDLNTEKKVDTNSGHREAKLDLTEPEALAETHKVNTEEGFLNLKLVPVADEEYESVRKTKLKHKLPKEPQVPAEAAPEVNKAPPENVVAKNNNTEAPLTALSETNPFAEGGSVARQDQDTYVSVGKPKKYTLQLYASYKLSDAQRIQKQFGDDSNFKIWKAQKDNKSWYVVTYRDYENVSEAKKDSSVDQVAEFKPWVRNVGELVQV